MDAIWSYIFPKRQTNEDKDFEILEKTAIFADLPRPKQRRLLRLLHERHYKADEVIFSVGEPGIGMYIVCEGEVAVYISGDAEQGGESGETLVATLLPGDLFGDIALFGECRRSATVKAVRSTRLLGLVRPEFLSMIKREPALGCEIMTRLLSLAGKRLEFTNQQYLQARQEISQLRFALQDQQAPALLHHAGEISDPYRHLAGSFDALPAVVALGKEREPSAGKEVGEEPGGATDERAEEVRSTGEDKQAEAQE